MPRHYEAYRTRDFAHPRYLLKHLLSKIFKKNLGNLLCKGQQVCYFIGDLVYALCPLHDNVR